MQNSDYSIAILAGGQSRRMGQNKAFIEIDKIPLLQRVINVVQALSANVFLVTNEPETYQSFQLPMVADVVPEKAALGGIYSAIFHARSPWVFVVACDMPLLNPAVINYLARQREQADIVIPLIKQHPETLHAFYHKQCLYPIYRKISQNRLKVTGFFGDVNVNYVERDALTAIAPNFNFTQNLNTPEDIKKTESLIDRTYAVQNFLPPLIPDEETAPRPAGREIGKSSPQRGELEGGDVSPTA